MLTDKHKTENYKPPTVDKNQQVTTSESESTSEEEEVQRKAIEEYQKLGPEDNSVDIIHKP